MTDAEIICTFMEPKPLPIPIVGGSEWWPMVDSTGTRVPVFQMIDPMQHLGVLWQVEDRLSSRQWWEYGAALACEMGEIVIATNLACIHATPEQKTTALAAVLRPIVERA